MFYFFLRPCHLYDDGMEEQDMRKDKKDKTERGTEVTDTAVRMRRANDMAVTLMKDKNVLAVMARDFIHEYNGMTLDQVKGYMGSDPLDTKIITDAHTKMVADVIYEIRVPVGDNELKVLFNIEAQQTDVLKYPLEDRQQYYIANMLSAQNVKDSEYGMLRPCYTIWVLMSPKHRKGNTIVRYSMRPEDLEENTDDTIVMDKMNIISINLGDPNADVRHESLRMLNAMFSSGDMAENERVKTIRDIGIDVDMDLSREVREMIDDPEMIMEAHFDYGVSVGMAEGMAKGMAEGVVKGRLEGIAMSVAALCRKHGTDIDDTMSELEVPDNLRNEVRNEVRRRLQSPSC